MQMNTCMLLISSLCYGRRIQTGGCAAAIDADPHVCVRAKAHSAGTPGETGAVDSAAADQV